VLSGNRQSAIDNQQSKDCRMAVAVKNEAEVGKGMPPLGLASASLVATAYIVVGSLVVYHGLPLLYDMFLSWWTTSVTDAIHLGGFMYEGFKLVLIVLAVVGLIWFWPKLFKEQPGLRAGAAVGTGMVLGALVLVYLVTWLVCKYLLTGLEGQNLYWAGVGVAAATGAICAWFIVSTYQKPHFQTWLQQLEEQGWFTIKQYKKGQGLRVRRGTMIGLLAIVFCGLWTYVWNRTLTVNTAWQLDVPFDAERFILVMYAPALTLSVLIAVVAGWFCYRLVNWPRFADFLIATDAELNKVSWSSQKKLVQDTIVVLVTLAMMATFLLLMDLLWSFVLKSIGVLHS
jgi:preprotein translocase SecE subunit